LPIEAEDLPRQFGPFTLLRLLAQGGMGAVYLALRPVEAEESRLRHLPAGQEEVCVVKTVRADLRTDREAVGRFLDEARVVQKLEHPRIARTLDAGVVDSTYYLALEFISGRNLRDVHTRAQKLGQALPEALIVHVLSETLEALEYAHRLKDVDTGRPLHIVHRDISPHNVMLGFDGTTRLIDFGLAAHELKRELTRPGVMVGKLRYNAPEQVRDRAIDGRSDVYAAGVVMYEFIANERFYEGLPEEQVWRVAMKGDHRPPSWRDIDIEWRHLLDVALQNDPEKRYRDARAFRLALLDVAEARGVDLSGMRKVSKAFVAEIFAREQVLEREMILQATGMAEARTRLVRSPSELKSAIANLPAVAKPAAAAVAEMRTEILDTAAAHLHELRDLASHFADPTAQTALPSDPVRSASLSTSASMPPSSESLSSSLLSSRETVDDTNDDPVRHAAAPARHGAHHRGNDDETLEATSESVGAASPPIQRTTAATTEGAPETVVGRRRAAPSSSSSPPSSPSPSPSSSEAELGATSRVRRFESRPPAKPSVDDDARRPIAALVLGLALVTVVGVVAIMAIPHLLASPPTLVLRPDAGVALSLGQDPPPPPRLESPPRLEPPPPSPEPNPEPALVPEPTPVPEPVPAPALEPEPAPEPMPEPPPAPEPIVSPPKRPPTTTRSPKGPPTKVPTGLPGQLGYLKQHCVGRVQCARSLLSDAENFATLSPSDLRDLKEALPRCIEKCQRN
jgi:serine/threonine protein kinase